MRQRAVTPGKVPELEMRTRPGVICATISMVTWTWMADVSAPGCTSPLLMSCLYGHAGITTLLLEDQAIASRASDEGFSPLKTACANGHADVARLLLRLTPWIHPVTTSFSVHCLRLLCRGQRFVQCESPVSFKCREDSWPPLGRRAPSGMRTCKVAACPWS